MARFHFSALSRRPQLRIGADSRRGARLRSVAIGTCVPGRMTPSRSSHPTLWWARGINSPERSQPPLSRSCPSRRLCVESWAHCSDWARQRARHIVLDSSSSIRARAASTSSRDASKSSWAASRSFFAASAVGSRRLSASRDSRWPHSTPAMNSRCKGSSDTPALPSGGYQCLSSSFKGSP